MKILIKILSAIIILGLNVSIALAQGHQTKIIINCPDIGQKGSEIVTNYGTYLAGPGFLRVNGDAPIQALFKGPIVPGSNIPTHLTNNGYQNNGISYNPSNGTVTCYYNSNKFDPFSINYTIANAEDGMVSSSSRDEMEIKLPLGFK